MGAWRGVLLPPPSQNYFLILYDKRMHVWFQGSTDVDWLWLCWLLCLCWPLELVFLLTGFKIHWTQVVASSHPVDEDVAWQGCVGVLQAAETVHDPGVIEGYCNLCQTAICETQQSHGLERKVCFCVLIAKKKYKCSRILPILAWPHSNSTSNQVIS